MKSLNRKFLSEKVRALLIAEMIEHESECDQWDKVQLNTIEGYWQGLDDISLLSEYSDYFGA